MYSSTYKLRTWIKSSQNPMAKQLFVLAKNLRAPDIPAPRWFFRPILFGFLQGKRIMSNAIRVFVWTPLFKSQMAHVGKRLFLYSGLPFTSGPLQITAGDDCRISGKTTITGRQTSPKCPELILGNNIDIGWQTTIAVGKKIVLGNNVRIAGQCFLAGYPGHPLRAKPRAQGSPETDAQVGNIILRDDVWLATGVMVMPGVTIGEGTVVAAGSVVTKDLPANVLAAGSPARVVRTIMQEDHNDG